jgi:hypothetical protein
MSDTQHLLLFGVDFNLNISESYFVSFYIDHGFSHVHERNDAAVQNGINDVSIVIYHSKIDLKFPHILSCHDTQTFRIKAVGSDDIFFKKFCQFDRKFLILVKSILTRMAIKPEDYKPFRRSLLFWRCQFKICLNEDNSVAHMIEKMT